MSSEAIMTSQAIDGNANGGSTQSSLGSTPSSTSTTSKNVPAESHSETSMTSEHEDHSKARAVSFSGESGTHQPSMGPDDAPPSFKEGEGKKPKDLTVTYLRDTLIQIMKDADLDYYQQSLEDGEEGLGARITRLARDHLNDQAALLGYVDHLEKTVASLTGIPKVTETSTTGTPDSEIDAEDKPDIPDPQQQSNPWKVEVKRLKEVRSEDEIPVLTDDASASKESQDKNPEHDGHVLVS